uniref:Putative secreted protein n=1 Tax=Anopheles triannulatus TaxID=58253 RepID=A0A2M4B487_9DIPT
MYFMLVFVFKFTFVSHAQTPVLRREGIRGKNDGQGESVSTLQTYARSLTIPTVAPNPPPHFVLFVCSFMFRH